MADLETTLIERGPIPVITLANIMGIESKSITVTDLWKKIKLILRPPPIEVKMVSLPKEVVAQVKGIPLLGKSSDDVDLSDSWRNERRNSDPESVSASQRRTHFTPNSFPHYYNQNRTFPRKAIINNNCMLSASEIKLLVPPAQVDPTPDHNTVKQIVLNKIKRFGSSIASRDVLAVVKQILNEVTFKIDQYVIEDIIRELANEKCFKLNTYGRRFAMELPPVKPDEKYLLNDRQLKTLWDNMSTTLIASRNSKTATNLLINSYGEWSYVEESIKLKMASAAIYQLIEKGILT